MNGRQKEILQAQLNNEKQVLKELQQVFKQAIKDCSVNISQLSTRTDMENIQAIIYQQQYQNAIRAQLETALAQLQSGEYATISDYLTRCYQNGYVGAIYDIAGQGIPLIVPIDQNAVLKALQIDSKLSKSLYDRLGEDVKKLKTSIRAEVSRGVSNGSSWNEIGEKISLGMNSTIDMFGFNKAKNNSIRIARTEGHRIQNQSAMDAQEAAKKKGADVLKQWCAALDGNTRPAHAQADGQIKELDEYFIVGGEKMKAPGIGGSAANVCNCRCALLQRARWALDGKELDTLKERAEYFGLDKSKDFEEYKAKYLEISEENVDSRHFKELTVEEFKEMKHSISKEERSIVYGRSHLSGYINSSNARKMNAMLRNGEILPDNYQEIADTLQRIINTHTLNDDIMVTRFVKDDALEAITGVKVPSCGLKTDKEQYWNLIADIPNNIKDGHMYIEKGFLSTSGVVTENVMQEKGIRLDIKVPKGTNCYVTTNNKESEIIFGRNTKLKIVGSKIENNRTSNRKIILECIIEE